LMRLVERDALESLDEEFLNWKGKERKILGEVKIRRGGDIVANIAIMSRSDDVAESKAPFHRGRARGGGVKL